MQKKKIILVISVCFYLAMAVLALTSRSVYEAGLPRVRICYLEQMAFWQDGAYSYLPALPKALAGQTLYYVTTEIKNKETHYVVKKADTVVLGAEKKRILCRNLRLFGVFCADYRVGRRTYGRTGGAGRE